MTKLVAQVFFTVLAQLWPFFGITHVTRAQNTILKVMSRKCWFDCWKPDFLKHLLVCNADCQSSAASITGVKRRPKRKLC